MEGARDTVTAALRRAVNACPDRVLVNFHGPSYTYRAFDEATNSAARGLQQLGVKSGQRVAALLGNGPEVLLSWFAVNKIGAIWVPMNSAYKGEFLRHQLADSNARIVVVASEYLPRLEEIGDELPELEVALHVGPAPLGRDRKWRTAAFDELLTCDRGEMPDPNEPADVMAFVYTSGTTGPSKGCIIPHNAVVNRAEHFVRSSGRNPGETAWTALPFFHLNAQAYGLVATILSLGSLFVAERFSLSRFWKDIEESGAVITNLLGSMIPLIARAPDSAEMKRCHEQLRFVGGSPFTPELVDIFKRRFGVSKVGTGVYGMTEAGPLTSLPVGVPNKPGTSGMRNRDFDTRIFDEHDREVPPNTPGEIVCRPRRRDIMFVGYHNRPDATLAAMRNLWFHSGDIGKFDEEGYFVFLDRKKDYLRRRGENISSQEVEALFQQHPAISEVAAYAVPSDLGEDDLKIAAVLKPGEALGEADLCKWAIDRMPWFAVPRYIEFMAELPKTPTGRVEKHKLRAEGRTEAVWDLEASDIVLRKR